jgi:hypothetical protein
MKTMIKIWMAACALVAIGWNTAQAQQKYDEERMTRDIEVAENVLSTLIKQELNQQRGFYGFDIKGTYLPGYGVTFRLPDDYSSSFMISVPGVEGNAVVFDQDQNGFHYTIETPAAEEPDDVEAPRATHEIRLKDKSMKDKVKSKRRSGMDSARTEYNQKVIRAAKDFILDYGDFISQLGPNEKIVITNQGEHNMGWYFNSGKRTHLSIDATKADILALKQGKLSREQALNKINVVNTESVDVKEPDMELLSSIFNRLYRADLSKSYFTEDNIYYERLKDYGVMFYMQVYSSNESDYKKYNMPTLGLEDVDQTTRDKKVAELYPKFEQEMKDNMVEYGRTLKSLKDNENLVFNVKLTRCKACNIPSTVEFAVKANVLKDYSTGKIDKNAAMGKISVKKGPNQ